MPEQEMELFPQTKCVQIVDANGYLLRMLRQGGGTIGLRGFLNRIRSCSSPPVFVFDGPCGNEIRRQQLPSYKTNRPAMGEDLFASVNFIRELLSYVPSVIVQVPNWEADDVLATMALSYAKQGQPIRVITPDRDLFQLAALPNVEVTCSYEHIPPHHVRIYKSMVGDPSDAVPGILRFGEKAWAAINPNAAIRAVTAPEFDEELVSQVGFKPGHLEWVRHNFSTWKAMWNVVGLLVVPLAEISANMKVGMINIDKMEQRLKEFSL